MRSTALLTDRYELTMLDAALRSGVASRRAAFEVFARALPEGRRYGVVCGVGRLVQAVAEFRFGPEELAALRRLLPLADSTLEWLAAYEFTGSIDAYPDGEVYFAGSPVCTVEATFGEAVLLETLVLSILNFDSAVAAAASRMATAAAGRPLVEMGSRRTHEQAAVAAARAAYIGGFSSTSNLEAGRLYEIPTTGTAAHAYVLAHETEREAFANQLDALGTATTLLVDTYDIPSAIETAVELSRERGAPGPGAVRIDSGKPADEVRLARRLLDSLGATGTRIVVTSDLDEFAIAELADSPVDAYGVGTRVVTGSGAPTAGFVYKLAAIARQDGCEAPLAPVAKQSVHKVTVGGRKSAWRELGADGIALREHVVIDGGTDAEGVRERPDGGGRLLPVRYVGSGAGPVVAVPTVEESRSHHQFALRELAPGCLGTEPGRPAIETVFDTLAVEDLPV
jgi:nicotinate phosphoribosyltransferase